MVFFVVHSRFDAQPGIQSILIDTHVQWWPISFAFADGAINLICCLLLRFTVHACFAAFVGTERMKHESSFRKHEKLLSAVSVFPKIGKTPPYGMVLIVVAAVQVQC